MYRLFRLGDKKLLVKPYDTRTELEILETIQFNELEDDDCECIVDELIERCVKNRVEMNKTEKILTVWFIRFITVGDELSVTFVCNKCGKKQNKIINLSDVFSEPKKEIEFIKSKILTTVEFENLDIDSEFDDELDIDEYESINLYDYYYVYNDTLKFNCSNCNSEQYANLMSFKQSLKFLSEESIESLSKWIHILVYSDNHTRDDVLKMTPLERLLEINYYKEQEEQQTNE